MSSAFLLQTGSLPLLLTAEVESALADVVVIGQRQNLAPCLRLGEAFCRHELHQFATKVRYSVLLCHQ